MNKNKKIITSFIIIISIVLISAGIIYAYFTFQASNQSTLILGYNKIQLSENYVTPRYIKRGTQEEPFIIQKEPFVTNIGNVACYVRLKSVVSDSRVEDDLNINYNLEDFTYNSTDGYYYYNNILQPGQTTEKLFTTVRILPKQGEQSGQENEEDLVLEGFDIYVFAEAIQTVPNMEMSDVWNYFNN